MTLGNAAGRVISEMTGRSRRFRLTVEGYEDPHQISICGVNTTWFPLVHPAGPPDFQTPHQKWLRDTGFVDYP